jgi:hypothetical protein
MAKKRGGGKLHPLPFTTFGELAALGAVKASSPDTSPSCGLRGPHLVSRAGSQNGCNDGFQVLSGRLGLLRTGHEAFSMVVASPMLAGRRPSVERIQHRR